MSLKLDLCNFSGYKIYPSRGIRLARTDGKIYNFVNKKSRNAYLMKKNPRKIAWTVLYRYCMFFLFSYLFIKCDKKIKNEFK